MKNKQLLIKICFMVGCLALLMSIADYLSLHDIWHDYVSKQVIESYGGNISSSLPYWSQTRPEWKVVNISWVIRIFYFIISLATFVFLLKKQRNEMQ
jgi:hypothetical protein